MIIQAKLKIILSFAVILVTVMAPLRLRADQADVLYRDGLELEKKGQRDFAVFKYFTIIRSHPGSKWADASFFKVGEFYFVNKDYFNAKENFEKLITQYPKSSYAESAGQYLKNIAGMSKKSDLESAIKKILSDIEDLKNEQNWDEMLSECDKLSAFEPLPGEYQAKLIEYYKACGNAFKNSESWDNAKAAYEKIMKITPEDTEALNQLYEINKLINITTR
jgi:tetratricopeptide (TPR) repeat protein